MTDQSKISKLLEVAAEKDQVKLKVLHNAVITCLKRYQVESTSAHLNDWQRAEKGLDDFIEYLWSQHFQEEKVLPNVLAVADYLTTQGWKAGKSTIYKHQKEGKLRPQPDGAFRIVDAEKYASTFLKRLDGGQTGKLDQLQKDKLIAETRKAIAQAEHWEMKMKTMNGALVPKDYFDNELAKRAIIFRNDLENYCRTEAAGIITLADGNTEKLPDVVEYMLDRTNIFLGRYAEEKNFTIPLPVAEEVKLIINDEEEEDED